MTTNILNNIGLLAKYTCLEGIRHRALWAILVMAVILSAANVYFTTLFTWDLGKVSVEFGLSSIAIIGLLIVYFLGLKVLTDDLEHGRLFMVLSRPISVGQYLWGKYLGLCLILLISSIVLTLASSASVAYTIFSYPAYIPPGFSWTTFFMAALCQFLQLTIIMSICVFWFSFASSPFVALIFSFGSYLVGQNLELLRRIVIENLHAGILTGHETLATSLTWIFPNLSFFDKKYIASYGFPLPITEVFFLIVYAVGYSTIIMVLAVQLYKRKEMA